VSAISSRSASLIARVYAHHATLRAQMVERSLVLGRDIFSAIDYDLFEHVFCVH
jgi:hypothetical protein